MISIQDRLRTQGFINFMRHHAENPNTRSLIIKRDFTLNDIFYMCYHLLKNRTVRNLHLSFVETGVENNSNLLTPVTMAMPMKKKEPQILVTADRMDVTTNMFQPLSVLAHNTTVECNLLL